MQKIKRKGFMLILSSPSGAGKTTLSRLLIEKDENIKMSVSATTRGKRDGEEDGKDYYFISKDNFTNMVNNDEFLEHAEVFSNFYGTPKNIVQENLEKGVDVLFDIDWQGTEQITSKARKDVVSIFILPPSMHELENRLKSRAKDSEDTINYRMSRAKGEISHWDSYDYILINKDLERSLDKIYGILQAERLKRTRQQGMLDFVENLLS